MASVSRHRNVGGQALRWIEWQSVRGDYKLKRGERPSERSLGTCVYQFKRSSRYTYVCRRKRMTLGFYERWLRAGSKGKFYNANVRGVY